MTIQIDAIRQTRLQTMYRFMLVYMRDEMSMDGLSLQVEFDRDIFGSFFLLKILLITLFRGTPPIDLILYSTMVPPTKLWEVFQSL